MRRRKSPQEKGYLIPVMRRKSAGVYAKAWAKSLTPVNGKIAVCFDNGGRSTWDAANVQEIKNYKVIFSSGNLLND